MKFAQATEHKSTWTLPANDVWNIPSQDLQFEMVTGPGPHQPIKAIKGLVFGFRDGKVYGIRTAGEIRQDGLSTFGRVSVGHVKRKCFTGSRMFQREDGSLAEVAVLFI